MVTISLMILLTIIALGLLSLSSISLRSQSQGEAMFIARSNARLALMIAIGELQRQVGPDQRVTATADIAGSAGGNTLAAGAAPANDKCIDGTLKGLGPVNPGTRHWTGVFVNRDLPNSSFKKTPAARLERWLISGNETSATGLGTYTPASSICIVGANGDVANPKLATVLVGPRSVGSAATAANQFVAAPLVGMLPASGTPIRGAYAWWIGDEGVKSVINAERTIETDNDYASWVTQRRGWESVNGFANYPGPNGDADRELPKLATLATVELPLPSTRTGNPSPRQASFHAATNQSRAVLADNLNSGLRVDLSKAFALGLPTSAPANSYDNYPIAGGRVIPAPASVFTSSQLGILRWDELQRFFRLNRNVSGNTIKVTPRTGTNGVAIAPIVSDFRILMGVRLTGTANPYRATACGKLAVSIANPYPYTLEWDQDLEVEVKGITPPGNNPSRIWQIQSCVFISRDSTVNAPGPESAVFSQAIFRIPRGRLEPGQARAYTNSGRVLRPRASPMPPQVVSMSPVSSTNPFDFNQCVEVDNTATVNLPANLDVRESWQTTLIMLEMRLAGSSGSNSWLRRIESFELDNGYFSPNTRRIQPPDDPFLRNGPVPLMLYSYQISQPGMDYASLMPAGYEMGQRSSTLRTFADFNLRAARFSKQITSYNPPPYFMESNDSIAQLGPVSDAGLTGVGFTRNLAVDPLFWGRSSVRGSKRTVLFSIPKRFVSLAQFQHADLTNDDNELSISHQPGNAFGNSYATPFVKRSLVNEERTDYTVIGSPNRSGATQTTRMYYDMSHILNSSMWDRYFFSSIETAGGLPVSPAIMMAPGVADRPSDDPSKTAASLMVEGAFNINSTSESAWQALFSSTRFFRHPADTRLTAEAAFPRSLEQTGTFALPATGEGEDSFAGYRRLTETEIRALSAEMVRQVRLRGPFVSLSHFVNRVLADFDRERALSRSGALQQALDESGVNISLDGGRKGLNSVTASADRVTLASKEGTPRADLDGGDRGDRPADADSSRPDWAMTSRDNNFGAMASIVADRAMILDSSAKPEQGFRSTGIPGWVTQADILQSIGPVITARSDSFRIRTCGQARDAQDNVIATAWCEAVVQRMPEYVDPTNEPSARTLALNTINRTYGRKFEIVSFRWLSREDV